MSIIKLHRLGVLENGTERFQSQPYIGTGVADFIRGTDGIMKCYGMNILGSFGYYEYKGEYKIEGNIKDMKQQPL